MAWASPIAVGGILTLALGVGVESGVAQDNWKIDRILDLELQSTPEVDTATTKVQFDGPNGTWIDLAVDRSFGPGARRLRVGRLLDVRTEMAGTHAGQVFFLTDLLYPAGDDKNGPKTRVLRGAPVPEAIYDIDNRATPGPTIRIEQGSMVAKWKAGVLTVLAGNIRTVVTGTEVAFMAQPGGDSAYVYLKSGTIRFPDTPEIIPRPGDLYLLTPTSPPLLLNDQLAQGEREQWERATEYNADVVFDQFRWFRRIPWRWVGTAAVGGVGACLLADCVGSSPGPAPPTTGIVLIRLPFR